PTRHRDGSLSTEDCAIGCSVPCCSNDSTVVTCLPWDSMASTEHAYTVLLLISTVQAPHSARSHTRLAPVMSNSSRRASSRVTRGSRFALYFLPLMVNCMAPAPGPWTGTCSPAANTAFGPATRGTATEMLEILRKSRLETPERSSCF